MIHTASLFHDDASFTGYLKLPFLRHTRTQVIDSADTRRGLSSTNAKFGDKVAILAGDFLSLTID